ncbi:MAG: hypothetical protein LUE19_08570 [Clostridiales bacterium]|nr:hypothetical protein [Clostridiales bacterium]
MHLPLDHDMAAPLDKMNLALLPSGMRTFACYIQAHYAYLEEDYGKSIGIVQTALGLQPKIYPIPNIYLHLIATMDYMSLCQSLSSDEQYLRIRHFHQDRSQSA